MVVVDLTLVVVEEVDVPVPGAAVVEVVVVCHPDDSVLITRDVDTESPGYPPENVTVYEVSDRRSDALKTYPLFHSARPSVLPAPILLQEYEAEFEPLSGAGEIVHDSE